MKEKHRENIVAHIVMVHLSVVNKSKEFAQRLRRNNYVTPKNYLDFINTYLKLLEDKDKSILQQVLQAISYIKKGFINFVLPILRIFCQFFVINFIIIIENSFCQKCLLFHPSTILFDCKIFIL